LLVQIIGQFAQGQGTLPCQRVSQAWYDMAGNAGFGAVFFQSQVLAGQVGCVASRMELALDHVWQPHDPGTRHHLLGRKMMQKLPRHDWCPAGTKIAGECLRNALNRR
jgi:hypothetical protein